MTLKLITEHEMGEFFKVIALGRGRRLAALGFGPPHAPALRVSRVLSRAKLVCATLAAMHLLLIEDDLDLGRALQAALSWRASAASGCAAWPMQACSGRPRSGSTACCWDLSLP
jgi:hypothetical protein